MTVVFGMGPCYVCKRLFAFNIDLVPSVPINGEREPICRACVEFINPRRAANGLPPIVPLPGAYEPAPEGEEDGP